MKIISIVNQKGGCGKSTVALNLAINLSYEKKKVVIVDTDPQKSSVETMQSRKENGIKTVYSADNVHRKVQEFGKFDFVVIDSPPHNNKIGRSVVICSDVVIIPVQDSPLDIRSAGKTVDLITEAQKHNSNIKPYFLLSRIQHNTILAKELKTHLRKIYRGIPILKTEFNNRVAYKQSLIYGLAVTEYDRLGAASNEVNSLTKEVLQILK